MKNNKKTHKETKTLMKRLLGGVSLPALAMAVAVGGGTMLPTQDAEAGFFDFDTIIDSIVDRAEDSISGNAGSAVDKAIGGAFGQKCDARSTTSTNTSRTNGKRNTNGFRNDSVNCREETPAEKAARQRAKEQKRYGNHGRHHGYGNHGNPGGHTQQPDYREPTIDVYQGPDGKTSQRVTVGPPRISAPTHGHNPHLDRRISADFNQCIRHTGNQYPEAPYSAIVKHCENNQAFRR